MHSTLQRQLIRFFGGEQQLPQDFGAWSAFIDTVSQTYAHYDEDRKLIEHSLEISSKELNDQNQQLQKQLQSIAQQKQDLEKLNEMMIDREEKMMELKRQIAQLQALINQPTVPTSAQPQLTTQVKPA